MHTDKKVITLDRLKKVLRVSHQGKKIVLAAGSFDVVHSGHLLFLDFAKRQGEVLVVFVGSDRIIREAKGKGRPVFPEKLRLRMIAGFEVVDYVTLLDGDYSDGIGLENILKSLRPNVWVYSYESHNQKQRRNLAKNLDIQVVINPRIKPNRFKGQLSTTDIVKKLI